MCSSDKPKRRGFHLEHWQVVNIGLIVYDMLAVSAAYFLALWLRFDCRFSSIVCADLCPCLLVCVQKVQALPEHLALCKL